MLSLLVFMITVGAGIFGIILVIDFCEYLKTYRPEQYEAMTFDRPFGIPRQNFLVHPIKPHKLVEAIISKEEENDPNVASYIKKLRVVIIVVALFGVASFFIS